MAEPHRTLIALTPKRPPAPDSPPSRRRQRKQRPSREPQDREQRPPNRQSDSDIPHNPQDLPKQELDS